MASTVVYFHARFVLSFRRGKLLGFGQNAREIIP